MYYLGLKDKHGKVGVVDVFGFDVQREAYIAYANRLHASVSFASFPDENLRNVFVKSFLDCDVIELVAVDDKIEQVFIMSAGDFIDKYSILKDKSVKENMEVK